MPEVFTIIFFVSWLHDRKLASKVKASLSLVDYLSLLSTLTSIFHQNKNIEANKKTPRCIFIGEALFVAGNILEKGCDKLAITT